jgi:hypothetical protein
MLLTSRMKKILPSKRHVMSRPLSEHKTWVYTRHTALRHILLSTCLINKLILVKEARPPQYAHTFSSCTIGHSWWTGSKLALYLGRPLVQPSAQTQDTLRFLLVSIHPPDNEIQFKNFPRPFPPLPFPIQFSIILLLFDATEPQLLRKSLNKQQRNIVPVKKTTFRTVQYISPAMNAFYGCYIHQVLLLQISKLQAEPAHTVYISNLYYRGLPHHRTARRRADDIIC